MKGLAYTKHRREDRLLSPLSLSLSLPPSPSLSLSLSGGKIVCSALCCHSIEWTLQTSSDQPSNERDETAELLNPLRLGLEFRRLTSPQFRGIIRRPSPML